MTDKIYKVKDEQELKNLVEYEKECEEVARLSKNPSEMAKVILYHKYGLGECPCNNCK